MTVLEFGAGSGWLSRFLTQMGCRVVLLDVSPDRPADRARALRAAAGAGRAAAAGSSSSSTAGASICPMRASTASSASTRSITRPIRDAVIREFARILVHGGIAGFAEPGPRHAEAPRSQFESQTYGVVERDVDVHDLWRAAQACGFSDLRMCVFHGLPHHVSLREYEELLAGGPAAGRLAGVHAEVPPARAELHARQGGQPDAPTAGLTDGLACDIRATLATPAVAGQPVVVDAIVTNTGTATWLASDAPLGGVALGTHLYDASGTLVYVRLPLRAADRSAARDSAGRHRALSRDAAAARRRRATGSSWIASPSHVTWFALAGSRPAS